MDARDLFAEVKKILGGSLGPGRHPSVNAIQYLRNNSGLGLIESKRIVDAMAGKTCCPRCGIQTIGEVAGDPAGRGLQDRLDSLQRKHDCLAKLVARMALDIRNARNFTACRRKAEQDWFDDSTL